MKHWEKLAEEFNGLKEGKVTLGHVSTTLAQNHKTMANLGFPRRGCQLQPIIWPISPKLHENEKQISREGPRRLFF